MKYVNSDYSLFLKLCTSDKIHLNPVEIYKGCAIMAVNGHRSEVESELNPLYQQLLEIRRKIFFGQTENMQKQIQKLKILMTTSDQEFQIDSFSLLRGDLELLSGIISTIKGDYKTAGSKMHSASDFYVQSNDYRRAYKALANEHICINNTLPTYQTGELYALNEQCLAAGYYDVAGNIYKSYALELLSAGNVPHSIEMAKKAQTQYQKECFIDDLLIAKGVEAIGEALLQNWQRAKALYSELNTDMFYLHRKTKDFYHVLRDLLEGHKPAPAANHPLSRVPWKKLILKNGSLKMKLIEILRVASLPRNELIFKLWGENATHESYNQRFHSLLKETRESTNHLIHFDGHVYSVL